MSGVVVPAMVRWEMETEGSSESTGQILALVALGEDLLLFPAPTWLLITVIPVPVALLWPLGVSSMLYYTSTHAGKHLYIQHKNIFLKN